MPLPSHKTKIVATIGPASESPTVMQRLVEAGMDVARLGLAHDTLDLQIERFFRLRAAAEAAGRPLGILVDLPGPKVRAGAWETIGLLPSRTGGRSRGAAAIFDGDGQLRTQYLLAGAPIGERRGNGATYYYLADRNGSVRVVVNDRGEVVREQAYEPFGQPRATQNATDVEDYAFDGEMWDRESGLLYLRHRFYDPAIGRFISPDPFAGDLFEPRTLNRYVFASNDPVNRHDPTGLADEPITSTPPQISTSTVAIWAAKA